jgi:hypothetical protein
VGREKRDLSLQKRSISSPTKELISERFLKIDAPPMHPGCPKGNSLQQDEDAYLLPGFPINVMLGIAKRIKKRQKWFEEEEKKIGGHKAVFHRGKRNRGKAPEKDPVVVGEEEQIEWLVDDAFKSIKKKFKRRQYQKVKQILRGLVVDAEKRGKDIALLFDGIRKLVDIIPDSLFILGTNSTLVDLLKDIAKENPKGFQNLVYLLEILFIKPDTTLDAEGCWLFFEIMGESRVGGGSKKDIVGFIVLLIYLRLEYISQGTFDVGKFKADYEKVCKRYGRDLIESYIETNLFYFVVRFIESIKAEGRPSSATTPVEPKEPDDIIKKAGLHSEDGRVNIAEIVERFRKEASLPYDERSIIPEDILILRDAGRIYAPRFENQGLPDDKLNSNPLIFLPYIGFGFLSNLLDIFGEGIMGLTGVDALFAGVFLAFVLYFAIPAMVRGDSNLGNTKKAKRAEAMDVAEVIHNKGYDKEVYERISEVFFNYIRLYSALPTAYPGSEKGEVKLIHQKRGPPLKINFKPPIRLFINIASLPASELLDSLNRRISFGFGLQILQDIVPKISLSPLEEGVYKEGLYIPPIIIDEFLTHPGIIYFVKKMNFELFPEELFDSEKLFLAAQEAIAERVGSILIGDDFRSALENFLYYEEAFNEAQRGHIHLSRIAAIEGIIRRYADSHSLNKSLKEELKELAYKYNRLANKRIKPPQKEISYEKLLSYYKSLLRRVKDSKLSKRSPDIEPIVEVSIDELMISSFSLFIPLYLYHFTTEEDLDFSERLLRQRMWQSYEELVGDYYWLNKETVLKLPNSRQPEKTVLPDN